MRDLPKRLIEVDLPIKRISAHARREKSIRHGHISTLHIWWARRPLAACRAVVCASLWPDPADTLCPQQFRDKACGLINDFAKRCVSDKELAAHCSHDNWGRWQKLVTSGGLNARNKTHWGLLRVALLDFVADFADFENSTISDYLETSRALTQAAHEALGGAPNTKPLVVDPFSGGGAIPLESLRIGADAFASDLNPVAVLLNKLVLDYVPRFGQRLVDEVLRRGNAIKRKAEEELKRFYPQDTDGATPITYLWARTIRCEGPNCGAEVPLIRSLWLAKKPNRLVAVQLVPDSKNKCVQFRIVVKQKTVWVDQADPRIEVEKPTSEGTVKRGSATCPCCGYTTSISRVREQLKGKHGGLAEARLFAVVVLTTGSEGRKYRLPTDHDTRAVEMAVNAAKELKQSRLNGLSEIPNESTEGYHSFVNRGPIYGMTRWDYYFLPRQALAIATLGRLIRDVASDPSTDKELRAAVQLSLALCLDKVVDLANGCCSWEPVAECPRHLFARQAIPMVWDLAEGVPVGESSGAFQVMVDRFVHVLREIGDDWSIGQASLASATRHPLPDDTAQAFITDPPYYYSMQYADLADFFYVWLRRCLKNCHPDLFATELIRKDDEIIVQSPGHQFAAEGKNNAFYERQMTLAMKEGQRIIAPGGIGVVVFAHTSTAGWEAMIQAMLDAGWVITASWPIDTEMSTRVISQGRSVLASSIHLVCRPRGKFADVSSDDEVGDWRDVLQELPKRIHEWMPRLAEEGIVGADAIFACLGPALEIFSRYSSVEKANGEKVSLKEYLIYVWAAVSKEALTMLFKEADASGFEEDARLTAMWLWTLSAADNGEIEPVDEEDEPEEKSEASGNTTTGYVLEYDAARKIAQGLGAHLPALTSLVEVKGEQARLLSVSERTGGLFGTSKSEISSSPRKKKEPQLKLGFLDELQQAEQSEKWGSKGAPTQGATVLDRVHQCMILFGAGRSDALRRFLVDDGAGREERFWRLSQVLSYLYPKTSDEKRWIDGVLARKKGLGF